MHLNHDYLVHGFELNMFAMAMVSYTSLINYDMINIGNTPKHNHIGHGPTHNLLINKLMKSNLYYTYGINILPEKLLCLNYLD